MTKNKR